MLREMVHPAYVNAVVPTLAVLAEEFAPHVRLLTIGGGDGHFSRSIFPELEKQARKAPCGPMTFEVLETDPDPIVSNAPAPSLQCDVESLPKKIAAGAYDLVVGESMFHHVPFEKHPAALQAIRAVTRDRFIFFHVQDTTPISEELSGEAQAELGLTREQTVVAHSKPDRSFVENQKEVVLRMQERLVRQLARVGNEIRLSSFSFMVTADELVPAEPFHRVFGALLPIEKSNSIHHRLGMVHASNDPNVPPDKVKVQYSGIITVLASMSTTLLAQKLQRRLG